jgi:hypothetical protein
MYENTPKKTGGSRGYFETKHYGEIFKNHNADKQHSVPHCAMSMGVLTHFIGGKSYIK